MMKHTVIPPYLLDGIAERGAQRFPRAAAAARSARMSDDECRGLRVRGLRRTPTGEVRGLDREAEGLRPGAGRDPGAFAPDRRIHDAENREILPGALVRSEGEGPVADESVNEAYDGLGKSYTLYAEAFGRDSLDDAGMPLIASVHYGQDYDNAFFDGRLMVFGDGDGEVFTGFTGSVTIIGHELSHGIISHTANLEYFDQPGALNEHCADVFGALTEQHALQQTAEEASWLIGAGIFTPEVTGEALRSMIAPGTAYDDDVLGKDPQPDHMDGFIVTESDNGGVHLNSGIPNRAFALAATRLGGHAWETVGQVWYAVIVGPDITTRTDFAEFAALTTAEAARRFVEGSDAHHAVIEGWTSVGVLGPGPAGPGQAGDGRSGGGSSW